MNAKWLALALVLGSAGSAQAQGPCEPERTINALANAVTRVAPLFIKPRAAPETLGLAPLPPPPSAPQPSMTREEWKQSLIEQGRRFCERYPDDSVCSGAQQ